MSIFDKFKRQNAAARLIQERLYEIVVDELQNNVKRNGLWAKAFANSDGNESKAKALYISYRVRSLKDESQISEALREQKAKDALIRKQQEREHEANETRQRSQEQRSRKQQEREHQASIKSEEAKEILQEKGYVVRKMDFEWIIIEPLGGRQKISTAEELYQYALSRENHRKT
jgi:hypothetical protein